RAFSARLDVDWLMRRAEILTRSANQSYDSLSSHVSRYAATPSVMPVPGRISSPFAAARFDPVLQIIRPHEGIDIAAPPGTPIMASAAGVVARVSWEADGYGNYLLIEHGYGVVTRYAHCLKILVTPGQRVTRGQVIALVGSTGEATGPHVHYEVLVYGKPVDPMRYIQPSAIAD
ncbi:MAG TPA: M23 family metallopeptidase, partial [Gemmatimonadales bacterium]|nr:M23 family metallopeptidase [Gemmatimonadales bacterium]